MWTHARGWGAEGLTRPPMCRPGVPHPVGEFKALASLTDRERHCGDGELVHMMLPDGLYIRPDTIPSNTRSLKGSRSPRRRKKDSRSRSKEKKSKPRKDIAYEQIGFEGGFLMPNDSPVYANSLSAPTSPAQNISKPRNRHRKGNTSYNSSYKKVSLIFLFSLV